MFDSESLESHVNNEKSFGLEEKQTILIWKVVKHITIKLFQSFKTETPSIKKIVREAYTFCIKYQFFIYLKRDATKY